MNFSSFEYFIEVEKTRSFSKAAEKLSVTQQAISSHISSLEKELGCQLFVRHIPLELTYAGELYLKYSRNFLNSYTAMLREFQDISADNVGRLKVGITHTRGRAIMPDIIEKFQEKYPHYEIKIVETTSESLIEMLQSHEIDIAIGYFKENVEGIEIEHFYEEELLLLIPKKYIENAIKESPNLQLGDNVLATKALEKCPMVLGSPQDMSGILSRRYLSENKLHPIVKAQAENIETLLMLCVKGVGGCFCWDSFINGVLGEEELKSIKIVAPNLHYPVNFATVKDSYQWNAIQYFKEVALDNIESITGIKGRVKRDNLITLK